MLSGIFEGSCTSLDVLLMISLVEVVVSKNLGEISLVWMWCKMLSLSGFLIDASPSISVVMG